MSSKLYEDLCRIVGTDAVFCDEPMSRHTTFRTGGPAEILVTPDSESLPEVIVCCRKHQIPCLVIGNGSNLVCGDGGVEGVVVEIGKRMSEISVDGDLITAQAGALLSGIAAKAAAEGLTGFEFAAGIPGSIGGAVVMNAGAYGGEMKDIVRKVTVLDQDGEVRTLTCGEMQFGYRTSLAKKKGYIVLGAELTLKQGEKEKIREEMQTLKAKRIEKQPLEFPSAGSTFKRPEGYFAGKLIMDAGLRGAAVGGAQVSEKHCGFVVNTGNATAADVRELMRQVQGKVQEQFGVHLEPEVRFLGEF